MSEPWYVVDIFDAARVERLIAGHLAIEAMPRLKDLLASPSEGIAFRWQGRVDEAGRPAGELSLRARLVLHCDRCGELVDLVLDETCRFWFVSSEAELERLPVEDTNDEPMMGSTRFDLRTLVEDQAILALPISPRHTACAGHPSAAFLATGDGDRVPSERQRPFSVLAGFKPGRQGG